MSNFGPLGGMPDFFRLQTLYQRALEGHTRVPKDSVLHPLGTKAFIFKTTKLPEQRDTVYVGENYLREAIVASLKQHIWGDSLLPIIFHVKFQKADPRIHPIGGYLTPMSIMVDIPENTELPDEKLEAFFKSLPSYDGHKWTLIEMKEGADPQQFRFTWFVREVIDNFETPVLAKFDYSQSDHYWAWKDDNGV
ncbi:hypothetical protein BJY04DRAFT_180976 [Aspergillus karnatakaensis]|uniref:uncharacterized protein n=1 Tax=Aspergillus karnatakaensis TaxID=1810916 RepID=UPI003CCE3A77